MYTPTYSGSFVGGLTSPSRSDVVSIKLELLRLANTQATNRAFSELVTRARKAADIISMAAINEVVFGPQRSAIAFHSDTQALAAPETPAGSAEAPR